MSIYPYPEGGQGKLQQQNPAAASSLLVADCGSVFTKVSLFGLVEGQYRLMARGEAPTTIAPPQDDITTGVIQAINVIEFITGRRFVEDGRIISPERANGHGVDMFIATLSAGGPLRLVVLGAVSNSLQTLAEQAIFGLYAEMDTIAAPSYQATLAKTPEQVVAGQPATVGNNGVWSQDRIALEWERQINRFLELQPHAALIVGMAEPPTGPLPLQDACQLLVKAAHGLNGQNGASMAAPGTSNEQCSVLYAGAPQYVEAVRRMINGAMDVTRVDPLSPQSLSSIGTALGTMHERNVINRLPGYERLQSWSGSTPIATATSLSSLVRFLAQHYAMNVTAIDVGGTTTTVMLAGERGEFIPVVNSGIGVGPGMAEILQQVGWQRVARWLPFTIAEDEIRQFVLNHMLHPHTIPTDSRGLQISQAFA